MSDNIVVLIRDCKNPKCGHDRSNHLEFPVMVRKHNEAKWTETISPMNCQARGCDCQQFLEDTLSLAMHKDAWEKVEAAKLRKTLHPWDIF